MRWWMGHASEGERERERESFNGHMIEHTKGLGWVSLRVSEGAGLKCS